MLTYLTDRKIKASIATTEKYIEAATHVESQAQAVKQQYTASAQRAADKFFADRAVGPIVRRHVAEQLGQVMLALSQPRAANTKAFTDEASVLKNKRETLQNLLAWPKHADKRATLVQSRLTNSNIKAEHGARYVSAKIASFHLAK